MTIVPAQWPRWQYVGISTLLIIIYAAIIFKKEFVGARLNSSRN